MIMNNQPKISLTVTNSAKSKPWHFHTKQGKNKFVKPESNKTQSWEKQQ